MECREKHTAKEPIEKDTLLKAGRDRQRYRAGGEGDTAKEGCREKHSAKEQVEKDTRC